MADKLDIRYQVTSPLAIIPDETDGQKYLYLGDLVPTNCPADIVEHLVKTHLVAPVPVAA